MKVIILILAITTIYCVVPPTTVQTRRFEVPKAQRKKIFKELGLEFNETLNEFCDEVKNVLEPKVGVAVSNANDIKTEENENSTRAVYFRKCLTKEQEEKKLFEHGFACVQKRTKQANGTYSEEQANCTKLEYRLECCNSTVTAECEDYFDDFASFKCAYCFSQGQPHPCNVLDEYKDLYYKAKETVKKVNITKNIFNENKNNIKTFTIIKNLPQINITLDLTKQKADIEGDHKDSINPNDISNKIYTEFIPGFSQTGENTNSTSTESKTYTTNRMINLNIPLSLTLLL